MVQHDIAIVIAATHDPWANRLVEWVTDHGGPARLRDHYVVERADALSEDYDCLVVEAEASLLDPGLVDELHARGRVVVGVHNPDVSSARHRLVDCGVDRVVAKTDSPASVLAEIIEVAATRHQFTEVVDGLDDVAGLDGSLHEEAPDEDPHSVLTVVTGATEGVGATEATVAIAAALAGRGERVTVVDADVVAPSLAVRLGAPQERNLLAALDAVNSRAADVLAVAAPVEDGFRVIAGLEHPGRWDQVDADDTVQLLDALAAQAGQVVVNVGSTLEALPSGRHDATRAVLTAADRVVVIADASPTGLIRLCRWLADARPLIDDPHRVHVAFNRCDGREIRGEVEQELWRTSVPGGLWHLPTDPRVPRAGWAGQIVRTGRYVRAISQLVTGAIPATTARTTRRRRLVRL